MKSRADRYDGQLKENTGYDPTGKSTKEKMAKLREYKENQYDLLVDAVYKRRGWSADGIPTIETVQRLGIDFPDVVAIISKNA